MTVLEFPKKMYLIDNIEDLEKSIETYGKLLKNAGRSQGFLIGCIFSSALNLIIAWALR